jgi:transcriptional regulator with XRE-family HTH domain
MNPPETAIKEPPVEVDVASNGNGNGAAPGSTKPQPMLGRRLKELRVSRGLSLKEVAAGTGLSSSFISLVETGRNEMTVGRLVTMADFYEVGLRDLIPERDTEKPVVLRRGDRLAFDSEDHRVKTEMLAAWHHGENASGYLSFEPGGELEEVAQYAGPQFVLILAGEVEIRFSDDTSVVLYTGDSVWFEASRPHRHVNVGEVEARVVTVKCAARSAQG